MGCFRYIIVSSLHKGDDDEEDDDNNNNNNNVITIITTIRIKFKQLDHL